LQGVKYQVTATRSGPSLWSLFLNGGKTSVGVRPLADGGLLVLLDGRSHTVYWREEVGALRLLVDSKTALIEQENDPTQLRSPSPGKLVRFLVEDGEHIKAGEAYAEIEVMKMYTSSGCLFFPVCMLNFARNRYMPLVATEDGVPQYVKQPGVTLEPGDILGILTLDDPTRVNHAKPFSGQLPAMGLPSIVGSKPHQRLAYLMETLDNIMQGFDNQSVMHSTVRELFQVLRDPELPYDEATATLSTLSGRVPAKLEASIRAAVEAAHTKNAEFPSARLNRLIENYMAENVRVQDRQMFLSSLGNLNAIIKGYSGGLRAHEWTTISGLLTQYHTTEKFFSGGRAEDVVLQLRDVHREDLDKVIIPVLSHSKATYKNSLVLALLEAVEDSASLSAVEAHFSDILSALADLDSKATSKVALKAREVLIQCQLPSLEERSLQMGQILRSAVTQTVYGEARAGLVLPSLDVLKELVDSRYTVFDVLSGFFASEDTWISLSALEVYVRRAYRAYNLIGVDYEEGDSAEGEPLALTWTFKMQKAGSPPPTPRTGYMRTDSRVASYSDLSYVLHKGQEEPVRHGAIFAAQSLEELKEQFPSALSLLPGTSIGRLAPASNSETGGNVMNVALLLPRSNGAESDRTQDEEWHREFTLLANQFAEEADRRGLRRLTFMLCRPGQYPSYFTLRKEEGAWKESSTIRDIEPALAFQLELNRLSNFNITPIFVQNRQIHVYYAVGKENPADCRFFVRALVRPGRLRGNMRTADYLVSETDRLVTDILNALEVVSAQRRAADVNHISFVVSCFSRSAMFIGSH
jgi:acetyl-CoA carboxylase/biotin carboxylase 1